MFDQISAKLARELHEKKKVGPAFGRVTGCIETKSCYEKVMAQIIEVANVSYEARDQAQQEMALLRARADREQVVTLIVTFEVLT